MRFTTASLLAILLPAFPSSSYAQSTPSGPSPTVPSPIPSPSFLPGHWVPTWVSMPQLTEPSNLPPPPFNNTNSKFLNSTIRQTVHITVGGKQLRLRFSNVFGTVGLGITKATIALPQPAVNGNGNVSASGSPAIVQNTLRTLTFSNGSQTSIQVPNGAQVITDPIDFEVADNSTLTVSLFLAGGQASESITSHPGSRSTTWIGRGDLTAVGNVNQTGVVQVAHWYFLNEVDVWATPETNGIVVVGDSLTDGRGSTTDGNDRWPDQLFNRLHAANPNLSILNQAAGGNRILLDGLGPNALGRIERDVLALPTSKFVIIWEGVNDIGTADATTAAQSSIQSQIITAFNQIISRVHARGLPIFGATITPFCGPGGAAVQAYCDTGGLRDKTRRSVNDWIRTSGRFDGVFDFDAVVRDPNNTSMMLASIDVGDHLHMTPQGYRMLAESIPLEVFSGSGSLKTSGFI